MIPILYENTEMSFTGNGLGRLRDCVSCVVSEERNGIYELDFEYPVDGANFDLIECGRIIGVTHDDSDDIQPFDIVSYSKPIDGIVTFHAVHISYRQSRLTVKTGASISSLADAFDLLGTSTPTNPFAYQTDKTSTGFLACSDGTPRTVRQILGGVEGSILDAYGGEYEFDKFTVFLHKSRGVQRDFSIRYGVNMLEFNDETDISETYSSCIPYWTDGTEYVVGDVVTGGSQTITGRDECVPLDVSDKFEEKPTKADVESAGATFLASNKTFSPVQTITVSFVRLQELGYEEFANLYKCNLCDTIRVVFPSYNMSAYFKIVRTEWNVLQNKYEAMELGSLSTTLSEALGISDKLDKSTNIFDILNVTGNLTVGGTVEASHYTCNGKAPFTTFTATGTGNVGGPAGGTITCSGTVPSGYTPNAITSIDVNNELVTSIDRFVLTSNGASVTIRNHSSTSRSYTVTVTILCTAIQ